MKRIGDIVLAVIVTMTGLGFIVFASFLTIDAKTGELVLAQDALFLTAVMSIVIAWVRVGHTSPSAKTNIASLVACFAPFIALTLLLLFS